MSFTGFQLGLSDDLLEASKKVIESSAEYKKFFDSVLKKFNVTSPEELDGEKKKEFFDYIDANWNGEDEKGKDGKKEETEEEVKKKSEVNEENVLMDFLAKVYQVPQTLECSYKILR